MRDLRTTRYGQEFIAKVVASRALTPVTHGIAVEKPKEFQFRPVQFTFLSLRTADTPAWDEYRAMSLASSPTRPVLEYGTRVGESAWKKAFVALRPGDEVMVEGPVGNFVLDESRPAVLVAGGIGITPLKGMAEYATDRRLDIDVRLLYSNRDANDVPYRGELEALARANPRLSMHLTLTGSAPPGWEAPARSVGRIDAAMLREAARGLERPVYYVCGVPGLVENVRATLAAAGVPAEDVRAERFHGYA